jgi:predicted phosphodiesterase
MRVAVLSDVHGNLEALEAVGRALGDSAVDEVACLGDVVGYGPDPAACVAWVAKEAAVWVQGNHDRAALPEERGLRGLFRGDARLALDWTEGVLDPPSRTALRGLPPFVRSPWGLLAHANPDDLMAYVTNLHEAEGALLRAAVLGFPQTSTLPGVDLLWVGHTHLPLLVHRLPEPAGSGVVALVAFEPGRPVALEAGRWLVNPGSVGQPRDGDSRARWAVLDTGTGSVELRATAYDYRLTQRKMEEAGLPGSLVALLGP